MQNYPYSHEDRYNFTTVWNTCHKRECYLVGIAEEEHFDSLWVNERLLWSLNPRTPANSPDGNLPAYYQNVLDPLDTLTFAAANTDKITLGTPVIDMLFHNLVILARRFATLDVLSHGRSICGLGIGWSEDEYIKLLLVDTFKNPTSAQVTRNHLRNIQPQASL